jgi:tetratricopeptide (TPR) repeat protein
VAKKSKQTDTDQFVRKETLYLVSLLALAVGFFGGVMFGIFKSDSGAPVTSASAPAPAAVAGGGSRAVALEKETADNPQNVQAWIELGNAYFDSSQYEKAIRAYTRAVELKPDNANVLTDMGVMYRRAGKPQEAIKAFDRAIAVDPKHEVSRFNKGIVMLHDLKDTQGAIQAWEELLEVNPVAMTPSGQSVDQMITQMKKQMAQQGGG